MPRIPTYDTPQVGEQPLSPPTARLDTSGQGQALGQAVENVQRSAEGIADTVQREEEKFDALAITKAEAAFQARKNDLMYAPGSGLMYQQGEKALTASEDVYSNLQKAQENISQNLLASDRQRRLFAARMSGQMVEARTQVERHVGQQLEVAKDATVKANEDAAMLDVSKDYSNDELAARQTAKLEGAALSQSLSPEDGQARVQALQAKVAATRLRSAIDNQDLEFATTYFSTVKDQLGPEAHRYAHELQVLDNQVYGQRAATAIAHGAVDPESGLFDETKLSAVLDQVPEGPKRKAVLEALAPLREQAERSNRATVNKNYFTAFTVLDQTHSLAGVPTSTRSWLVQYAPDKWNELETKQHELQTRGRRTEGQANTPEESAAYGDALKDLNDNRFDWMGKEAKDVVAKYGYQLSPKDLHALVKTFADLKQGNDLKKLPAPEAAALSRVFQEELSLPEKQKDWDPEMVSRFHKTMDLVTLQRAEYIRRHKGEEPSQEEIDGWVRGHLKETPVPGTGFLGFFQKKQTAVDVEPPTAFIRDVTERVRAVKGRPPTPEEVRTLYQKKLERDRQKPAP